MMKSAKEPQPATVQIAFRVPPQLRTKAQLCLIREGETMQELLAAFLQTWVDAHEAQMNREE